MNCSLAAKKRRRFLSTILLSASLLCGMREGLAQQPPSIAPFAQSNYQIQTASSPLPQVIPAQYSPAAIQSAPESIPYNFAPQYGPAYAGPPVMVEPAPYYNEAAPYGDLVIPSPNQPLEISPNDERLKSIDPIHVGGPDPLNLYTLSASPYSIYRSEDSAISYLPAGADQFSWLSFDSGNYLHRDKQSGFNANFNWHLLSGPTQVAIPARLYDLEIGYQIRKTISPLFSYDVAVGAGIYSDFEGSVRQGFRYPSHAVGMFHMGPKSDFVFGVDYLSRDDVKILPVIGFCWHNPDNPTWRFEMVFPRPRIDIALTEKARLYMRSQLGGGSWDIEHPVGNDDVMTYRDIQILTGFERADSSGDLDAWEFGYVFNRQLSFRNAPDVLGFDDAFVIRWVSRH